MNHDISIIRPELRAEDFKMRGQGIPSERLKKIRKGLQALHALEVMAANIYKSQITREQGELNRQLIAAMGNELTHLQDFQIKLYEYGLKPRKWRWMYWLVGFAFGFSSRVFGKKVVLKTGIWAEEKAVRHYSMLLEAIEWDEETRKIIEKDQADERGHIKRWTALLTE